MSNDSNFSTGAVRSADANHLDYTSLPLVGLIGVARTAAEGAAKYGRLNYMRGLPVHDLLNHSINHIVQFLLGDRTQPHLEHAAWGLLASIQSHILDPEISTKHLLGPGAILSTTNLEYLASQDTPLRRAREAGEHDGDWTTQDIPEVSRLLNQRIDWQLDEIDAEIDADEDDDVPLCDEINDDDIQTPELAAAYSAERKTRKAWRKYIELLECKPNTAQAVLDAEIERRAAEIAVSAPWASANGRAYPPI